MQTFYKKFGNTYYKSLKKVISFFDIYISFFSYESYAAENIKDSHKNVVEDIYHVLAIV